MDLVLEGKLACILIRLGWIDVADYILYE